MDTNSSFPDFALKILLKCDKEIFPFMNKLLTNLSSLSVSVVFSERSLSSLRFKTWMGYWMSEGTLLNPDTINAHTNYIKSAIDRLANNNNKKKESDYILSI